MTNLINQISINGETTTFLNYVNPVVGGESIVQDATAWVTFFQQQLTSLRFVRSTNNYYNLRFNTSFETLTGQVASFNGLATNARYCFRLGGDIRRADATNGTVQSEVPIGGYATWYYRDYAFAVINNNSLTMAFFGDSGRSTSVNWMSAGWLKDGQYSGLNYPRNFYNIGDREDADLTAFRITRENLATLTSVSTQNPTLSCSVATPGANSTDVIIRDSSAPNNYIGKLWNMMVLPSTAVVGKIYRNTGIDPDTGQVETDQKAYWMCVGSWGTDKIGMRVWTENLI